jgi:hypothetical protein
MSAVSPFESRGVGAEEKLAWKARNDLCSNDCIVVQREGDARLLHLQKDRNQQIVGGDCASRIAHKLRDCTFPGNFSGNEDRA